MPRFWAHRRRAGDHMKRGWQAFLEIRRAELAASETKLTRVNDQAIRRVLKAAGVEFIDENGRGGRLRNRQQKEG
jgi:hypothetical protein